MNDLNKTLQTYFLDKAPKMPADIQKLIVQYGPYLILIGTVISAVGLLSAFGVMSYVSPLRSMTGAYAGGMYQVYMIMSVITVVLNALALPGLFKRSMQGWTYMFYNTIVGTVLSIITMNIFGLIIGSGLGFYVLYQVKNHYK